MQTHILDYSGLTNLSPKTDNGICPFDIAILKFPYAIISRLTIEDVTNNEDIIIIVDY
ncbi:MAG: hypothetical protein IPP38_18335 [Bacteroidetes bacterium]|nr:hypothetical protein [Bacteroidota bacterium]